MVTTMTPSCRVQKNAVLTVAVSVINSEFTQQDGGKKRTVKRLSVTNVTGLLLACFVANSLKIDVSYSSTKRSVQRNVKFGGSKAKAKLLSRLSQKVCRRLSPPVLLRKFTIITPTRLLVKCIDLREQKLSTIWLLCCCNSYYILKLWLRAFSTITHRTQKWIPR